MEKDRILSVLRMHRSELEEAGMVHLRLFGSMARGEEGPESDVDLLFESDKDGDLLGVYGYEDRVTEILGTKAHLSSTKLIRPHIMQNALQEAIVVY